MIDVLSSQPRSSADTHAPHELAIARTLLALLEGSLASDVRSAADVAQQLAEHLRTMSGCDA